MINFILDIWAGIKNSINYYFTFKYKKISNGGLPTLKKIRVLGGIWNLIILVESYYKLQGLFLYICISFSFLFIFNLPYLYFNS
jgi:hypothetical protein